jgi:DNA-binding Lrp family transcriptional regulator
MRLSELDKAIIRELQGTIPLDTLTPYAEIARRCGISEEELLAKITGWRAQGIIRRMGAVLKHQKIGKLYNAMSVWRVPDRQQANAVAQALMSYKEVTHCYERPTYPTWPYNLFGMMHCESFERCEEIAREVAARTGVTEYRLLLSTKEYKKESLQYF